MNQTMKSKTLHRICAVVFSLLLALPLSAEMVAVQGGLLPKTSQMAGKEVAAFQIGKFEVTNSEWKVVADWAVPKGYDLGWVGGGASNQKPVAFVTWFEAVKWCNAKSEKEGLTPVYHLNGAPYRTGSAVPTVDASATRRQRRTPDRPRGPLRDRLPRVFQPTCPVCSRHCVVEVRQRSAGVLQGVASETCCMPG